MENSDQKITDRSDLRKWRVELPNLYEDAKLDPFEFRLLIHYKRVGHCTEGLNTTARRCHMSLSVTSEKRKSLALKRFIKLTPYQTKYGPGYEVDVVDYWPLNFETYSKHKHGEAMPENWLPPTPTDGGLTPSHSEGLTHSPDEAAPPRADDLTPSHSETKKEPVLKKKQVLKNGADAPSVSPPSNGNGHGPENPATTPPAVTPPALPGWPEAERSFPAGSRQAATTAALASHAARADNMPDMFSLDEQYWPYALAFIDGSGHVFSKPDVKKWRDIFSYQIGKGILPCHLKDACRYLRMISFDIWGPESATKIAEEIKVKGFDAMMTAREGKPEVKGVPANSPLRKKLHAD
jgi:hypothetical protein